MHATGLALVIGLVAAGASAQEPAPREPRRTKGTWLSFMPYQASSLDGTGGMGALTFQRHHLQVSLRVASFLEHCTTPTCPVRSFDLGLLAGYASPGGRHWHAAVSTGLALGEHLEVASIGVPIEARVAWRPLRFLGLGVVGWTGGPGPPSGVGLFAQLGNLR